MNRFSIVRGDHIDYAFWLVFGADGSMRFSRGQPDIGRVERAMACVAKLPLALFRTPELKAEITIKEGVSAEFKIDVAAVGEALRQSIGVDIDLRVTETNNG